MLHYSNHSDTLRPRGLDFVADSANSREGVMVIQELRIMSPQLPDIIAGTDEDDTIDFSATNVKSGWGKRI